MPVNTAREKGGEVSLFIDWLRYIWSHIDDAHGSRGRIHYRAWRLRQNLYISFYTTPWSLNQSAIYQTPFVESTTTEKGAEDGWIWVTLYVPLYQKSPFFFFFFFFFSASAEPTTRVVRDYANITLGMENIRKAQQTHNPCRGWENDERHKVPK